MKIFKDNENDILNEIEAMSPEKCKGLLMGFFLGIEFTDRIKDFVDDLIDRVDKKISKPRSEDFRKIKLEFSDREEAEEVLDDLRERLEESNTDYVSIRDLYSLADLPTNSIMCEWVWHDLEDCSIYRQGDHYILKMPPAEYKRLKKDRASDIS